MNSNPHADIVSTTIVHPIIMGSRLRCMDIYKVLGRHEDV